MPKKGRQVRIGAENVSFKSLAAEPIVDPVKEKELDKEGYLLEYLCGTHGAGVIRANELKARLVEIYRMCYERSQKPFREIVDLIATHPDLAFQADWLQALAEREAGSRDIRKEGRRYQLFMAISKGFRQAARPTN